jgi:hypothetical protein
MQVSALMTDSWQSRLYQSMLSRPPGSLLVMRKERGDCFPRDPADAVALVQHHR